MTSSLRKVLYPDVDIVKLVMAFLVVEIHTRPFLNIPFMEQLVEGVDCLAVPFFFIVSGFFCFRGLSVVKGDGLSAAGVIRAKKTAFKLLRMYLIWTVLFLPITIFGNVLYGNSFLKGAVLFIRGTLLVGENHYSWPLWYLLAGAIGFALIYYLLRGGVSQRKILLISLVCLLAGFLITFIHNWSSVPAFIALPVKAYCLVFGSSRNGLFVAFFYVAVGMTLGLHSERLRVIPLHVEWFCVAAGVVGCIFVSNDVHLPFCAISSSALAAITLRRQSGEVPICTVARNASTVIYLVHMFFVVLFVYGICGCSNPELLQNDMNRFALYAFAICCSTLVAAVVIPLSRRYPRVKAVFGL